MTKGTGINSKMIPTQVSVKDGIINTKDLGQILLRYKKALIAISCSSLIFSSLLAITRRNIWAGEFQILVSTDTSINRLSSLGPQAFGNPGFGLINSFTQRSNKLSTEIEILKSPSVLMPVFNYVKERKKSNGINTSGMKYYDWLSNNLEVKLLDETNILDLKYKDAEKEIILPTLSKIIKTYQDYSGKNRSESINNGIIYLDKQIALYKKKSLDSLKKSLRYTKEYDMALVGDSQEGGIYSELNIPPIEVSRIESSQKIKKLNKQLNILQNKNHEDSNATNLAKFISSGSVVKKRIISLESDISRLETFFKEDDEELIQLKEERDKLVDLLITNVTGELRGELNIEEANLENSLRPESVLITYSELIRSAKLDEITLEKLKNDRRKLSLEKARKSEPWELISNPTLFEDPVAPNRKKIVLVGLIIGALGGSLSIISLKIAQGIIYDNEEIESILGLSILQDLSNKNGIKFDQGVKLIYKGAILKNNKSNVSIIPIGDLTGSSFKTFSSKLKSIVENNINIEEDDILDINPNSTKLLVMSIGDVTRNDLIETKKILSVLEESPIGIVLLGWNST